MPSYLDFNSTKRFRDFILGKTLQTDGGPQEHTEDNYSVHHTNEFANQDLPPVDADRVNDLKTPQSKNIYKPIDYPVLEELDVIQRRANLNIYPYFTYNYHNIVGISKNDNFEDESELMKFAQAWFTSDYGPIAARTQQNLYTNTVGRLRLIDALNGSISTATNIVTGKESLVESNYDITVAKTLPGKAIDFIQSVAGVEFPWTEIPGDYLSNPDHIESYRTEATTEAGSIIQDTTGVLGGLFGLQRRPLLNRKPSDLLIEYMGQGQKNQLFDMLSYSTYAPNYTTTARSQNTSKVFNFVDDVAQGVKNVLGMEAPAGVSYIGDDRSEDVRFAMGNFDSNQIKSPFYLSLMFDSTQAELFQREKNITESGSIPGKLTWVSINSKNPLGDNNAAWSSNQTAFTETQSTNFEFRYGSILERTQAILDSMPSNGLESRTHVANVIDQTSRFFRDGDKIMSRGSNVRYADKNGVETGVELCRVWTKDRPYMKYSDSMRRTDTIRKYDDSVLSKPWNLNIAPMSDGKTFEGSSTNMSKSEDSDGFYAKKYMFSLENLSWKSSNTPGYTYSDLPFCERGSNGGRVMWFPPYDLKVTEQTNANWETNSFLGRPEPIYTYQDTERTGQINFKVIVDHPSILNLLVSDHFKDMSDEQSENAINAFFAGCKDVDFYDLIDKYKNVTPKDAETIIEYLNKGVGEEEIKKYSIDYTQPTEYENSVPQTTRIHQKSVLHFLNDAPAKPNNNPSVYKSINTYGEQATALKNQKVNYVNELVAEMGRISVSATADDIEDTITLFGNKDNSTIESRNIKKAKLETLFDNNEPNYDGFVSDLTELKTNIEANRVKASVIRIGTSTSSCADRGYNLYLSIRRAHSIYKDVYQLLKKDGIDANSRIDEYGTTNPDNWDITATDTSAFKFTINLTDLGYEQEGTLTIEFYSGGEDKIISESKVECNSLKYKSDVLCKTTPESFECRSAYVQVIYDLQPEQDEIDAAEADKDNINPRTKIVVKPDEDTVNFKTPPIDEMKKIISKTLSECYYFKKLEDTDPVVFSSLKEKFKYFHPAFHSMTPEGLNSRLTFIQQCLRPGETIPIKGLNDNLDLRARNTSFGAPPVCVLRIGDFFNTKVVINNVNISYEESMWDLNPEGIGIQPMIADVSMQVAFIGGSGIKEPVGRLQNALSSNFYANTEMYDPRSTSTADTIAGKDRAQFTKEFIQTLNEPKNNAEDVTNINKGNDITEGVYIGDKAGDTLSYRAMVSDSFTATKAYFDAYPNVYNNITTTYGTKIGAMLLSYDYRTVSGYWLGTSGPIRLVGEYPKGRDLSRLLNSFKTNMYLGIGNNTMTDILGLDKVLPNKTKSFAETLILPVMFDLVDKMIEEIGDNTDIKDYLKTRDTLITALDKVNFIGTHGFDIKLSGIDAYKVNLPINIYSEYISNFDYIIANNDKQWEDLDVSHNFLDAMSTDVFIEFLSIFLYNNTDMVLDVFENNSIMFTDKVIAKVEKRLNKFITLPGKEKKFRFTKFKEMKNDNSLSFVIPEEIPLYGEITADAVIIDKATLLFSTKVPITNNKLNYFKR